MSATEIDRRSFIRMVGVGGVGLVVAPSILAACGGDDESGGEAAAFNVQLGWIANVENAGEFVAAERGYYTDENLDVTITPGGPGALIEPTVVSGQALIGLTNADFAASANQEGAKLRIVGTTLQKNPSSVMSLADNPIRTPKDLEGKRLGLQQAGEIVYEAFFQIAGVDSSKVEIVPVQFDPGPLVGGEVDAFASFQTNQPVALAAQGIETVTFLLADHGYNLFADAFVVTEATLADDAARDSVVRWLRATQRGWVDAIADPAAAAKIVVEGPGADLGLSIDTQTTTLQEFVPLIQTADTDSNGLFWMTDDGIALNVETMKSVGIDTDSNLFTNELLSEI